MELKSNAVQMQSGSRASEWKRCEEQRQSGREGVITSVDPLDSVGLEVREFGTPSPNPGINKKLSSLATLHTAT